MGPDTNASNSKPPVRCSSPSFDTRPCGAAQRTVTGSRVSPAGDSATETRYSPPAPSTRSRKSSYSPRRALTGGLRSGAREPGIVADIDQVVAGPGVPAESGGKGEPVGPGPRDLGQREGQRSLERVRL